MPLPKKPVQLANLRSTDALTRFGIDLLQEERQAILAGAFDRLEDIGDRKNALLDEIEIRAEAAERETSSLDRQARRDSLLGAASILSRRASENQTLLASALEGSQKAGDMLKRLKTGGAAGFYGASGQKITTATNQMQASVKL